MAIIAGVTVNWVVSPRIITVPVTETEVTIFDLQDTLLDLEDSEEGIVWPYLREFSGGEDLGGGVSVGYTMELQNAQLQFAARPTPVETGTCTANDTSGTVLTAAAGTFITSGIQRGDTVYNSTTGSMAAIISVDSETQLTSQPLAGGSRTDWQNTDGYKLYPNVQCSITGGNLVAVDAGGSPIDPVFQSPNTQVVRTSASSATNLSQQALEQALFTEGVVVDTVNGSPGTGYVGNDPIGSRKAPSNNMADAKTIADTRGVRTFRVANNLTLDTLDFSSGYTFVGDSPNYILQANASADVTSCTMLLLDLSGELDGLNLVKDCTVGAVTNASGFFEQCAFKSTVTLSGDLYLFDCYSQVAGSGYPTFNTGTHDFVTRDFRGSYGLTGMTGGDHSNGLSGGRLLLDATCTGGTCHVRSQPFEIIDNSNGTTVLDETESEKTRDIHVAHFNRRRHDTVANTITIYASDNTTPLHVFDADDALTDITPQ